MTELPGNQRRVHLLIHGVVQGVGFRFFVERHAKDLGLKGWVRNVANGAVEVLVEGPAEALDRLVQLCHQGPRGAMVESVRATWAAARGEFARFEIRPTAAAPLRDEPAT
ncbi:Acylphosphatase [bacterium HR30]|nr:Acylphosphatase [bacterium HR30]